MAENRRPQRASLPPEPEILSTIYSNNRANIDRLSGALTTDLHAAVTRIEICARLMLVVTAWMFLLKRIHLMGIIC
ncbi:hypothetical protein LTR27_002880 [Elasticomyces elasticus]|nr:hypothetical protein LTR27_002880 [Elasticomyces elasticus]